jgi:hypothetical protein
MNEQLATTGFSRMDQGTRAGDVNRSDARAFLARVEADERLAEKMAEADGDMARILAIAAEVSYRVNPNDPYPDQYTGHVRIALQGGRVLEERQPHLRGGHHEPLTRNEIDDKFRANCAYGGWPRERAERWLAFAGRAFEGSIDLEEFRR